MSEHFYDKDRNFLPLEPAKFVLRNLFFDKYAQSIARQAVNAERKRVVESQIPDNGIQRNPVIPVEKSQWEKNMESAFA